MKELSLNILDIAMNSIRADASLITIALDETESELKITISDDGCGMTREQVERVTDPFFTSRTTRKVGLGIPFFKLAAEQTGGGLEIESRDAASYPDSHGTVTSANFYKDSIDMTPLGDVVSSICTLIQGCGECDVVFEHKIATDAKSIAVSLDTRELKAVLGDIPLSSPEILSWMTDYLREQYETDL